MRRARKIKNWKLVFGAMSNYAKSHAPHATPISSGLHVSELQPPDSRKRRNAILNFFRRFGHPVAGSPNGRLRAEDLDTAIEQVAKEAGTSTEKVRAVLDAFTSPGYTPDCHPVCGTIPCCQTCPLQQSCVFANRPPPITDLPITERPRERLAAEGPQVLSNAELLAILIRTGMQGCSAMDLARKLIADCGDLRTLSQMAIEELKRRGIGPAKAAQIKAAFELGTRLANEGSIQPGQPFRSSRDVFERYHRRLRDSKKESFYILLLNVKNCLIRDVEVSVGSLSSSLVHPREVFREAIREAAHAVIFVHNHPSGDPTPSAEDRQITHQLKQTADIIGIKALDHIIVGEGRYVSFADDGLM